MQCSVSFSLQIMLKGREERFRSSVEELNKRLCRAENFLDTQVPSQKMNKGKLSRSSLPSEVYRDKNTLVEVTVHRNSRQTSATSKRDAKSWAESLSDTDLQFDKPTKSSLARSRPSPRKERKLDKRKDGGEKRSLQELLAELRSILEVSGVKDIYDFVAEFDQQKKAGSSSSQPRGQGQEDKAELERRQAEIRKYKEEYAVMVKQMEVSRDSVNSLELQVCIVGRMVRVT